MLLQVHGGAWILGNKEQQGIPLMQHLAAKGWVCVAINYRLAPRDPWPAQVVDVKRAIAWIREHIAAYGGDPDYIAITGGSAGGHLTALAALTPNDPDVPARLRGRRHLGRRSPCRTTASTTSPARPARKALDADARPVPRAAGHEDDVGARTREVFEDGQPDAADHPGRPRLLRDPRRPRHPRRRSTRPASSSPGCARAPSARWSTPSCPAPSTP